jgi:TRAP-type C4-dicarboxylate transport system substrate-binding protein
MEKRRSKVTRTFILILSTILLLAMVASAISCGTSTSTVTSTATTGVTQTQTTSVTKTSTTTVTPVTLIFSTHESNTGLYYQRFFKPWMDEIEKRTNGRVKIEGHFNGELAGPPDAWDALVNGTVDISNVHLQNVPGKFPMTDVVGFTTYGLVNQRPSYVLWQLYNKYVEMQKELTDCHVMFLGSTYWTSYAGTRKVTKLEDFAGLKATGVGTWQNKRSEALGMVPVSMGPADILPALQSKVIDGGPLGTLLILLDFGWGEFLPYVTHVRQECIPILLGMNMKVWNSLPADVQQALDGMREWTVDLHDTMFVNAETELIPQLRTKFKTDFYTPPDSELARWDALDKPIWDEFGADLNSKGLPGTQIMKDYIALEQQYSIKLSDYKMP